ncbi:MAG TPA: GH92 family glycosyl hydrolase [Mycobacteriales bacterium]|nr:GH92 family glycosyl hydrolase [Mycobacteriales bacterium]
MLGVAAAVVAAAGAPALAGTSVLGGPSVVIGRPAAGSAGADPTALVNPLAGTLGAGFVTVGAGVPFGMVTPGPATTTPAGDDPVNYVGYGYQDPQIRGFALTHFSGAGIHIGGELPVMPTTGAVTSSDPTQFASPYSHADEVAQPGYYAATLTRYGIRAELTATTRVAVERFTFPAGGGNLLFDVGRDNAGLQRAALHVVDDRTITGRVFVPDSGGVTMWFTARFDQPMTGHGTWLGSTLSPGGDVAGSGAGGWASFGRTVVARIALSYVDADGATANLQAEAPDGTGFDRVRTAAHEAWNRRLHRLEVTGGSTQQRQTFYSCLYHALLMPTTYDDADGRYRGFDDAVHTVAAGAHHYTDLSLWDTYRTQTPLLTLVAPEVAHDLGVSLLDDTDQNGGVIPKWVRGNRDYSIMGGDSGTPTLATLVTNGALAGAEAQRAYAAIVHQATTLPPVPGSPRSDLPDYLKLGYIPFDHSDRGAAVTLEYAIDDAAIAALAPTYGTSTDVARFTDRARSWHHLLDPSDHFLRPRNSDGSWADPTSLGATNVWSPVFQDGWQEGTGWQYLWLVPQDVAGLEQALGRQTMLQRLDEFFTAPAQSAAAPVVPLAQAQASLFGVYYAGNQFTPANETDLQAPWLYDWLGEPWRTQQVVHAEAQVFNATPYGLPGNDDAGTMSAAYVLSAIGLYQAQPGVDAWELSTPMFPVVVVNGPRRPLLTIEAPGAGPTTEYAGSATLSGPGRAPARELSRAWLTNDDVHSGRTLTFTMQSSPSDWATGPAAAPPSL